MFPAPAQLGQQSEPAVVDGLCAIIRALGYSWVAELVRLQSGRFESCGNTVLLLLFCESAENGDSNSIGFKLLWGKEGGTDKGELRYELYCMPDMKAMVVSAMPSVAVDFDYV